MVEPNITILTRPHFESWVSNNKWLLMRKQSGSGSEYQFWLTPSGRMVFVSYAGDGKILSIRTHQGDGVA